MYATFMPKPSTDLPGSGMHTHLSLFEGDQNAFHDSTDEYHLSKVGKAFIAGVLHHAARDHADHEPVGQLIQAACHRQGLPGARGTDLCLLGQAQSIGSCTASRCTSRARNSRPGLEIRSPDPACNPYLAFSVILAAGLKGIDEGYELPPEATDNIYEMHESERRARGITQSAGRSLRGPQGDGAVGARG